MWDILLFRLARTHRYPWRRRLIYGAILIVFIFAVAVAVDPHPRLNEMLLVLPVVAAFYLIVAAEVDAHLRARESRRAMDRLRDKHMREKDERTDAYALAVSNQRGRVAAYERASYERIAGALQALHEEDANRWAKVRDMYLEEGEKLRAATLAALKQIEEERRRDGEGWKRP